MAFRKANRFSNLFRRSQGSMPEPSTFSSYVTVKQYEGDRVHDGVRLIALGSILGTCTVGLGLHQWIFNDRLLKMKEQTAEKVNESRTFLQAQIEQNRKLLETMEKKMMDMEMTLWKLKFDQTANGKH